MTVSVHVTECCNLNCASCFHMIPLSDGINYYIENYIRPQLQLLAKHENIVDELVIMGGEPTTHPDIISILYVFREHFPNTKITLATNGTLLSVFNNIFFIKALQRTDINVSLTEYPFVPNYEYHYKLIHDILDQNNIKYTYNFTDKFLVQPFHKELHNNIHDAVWCKAFHYCTMLKDDKLYKCHLCAYVDFLLNRFPEIDWIKPSSDDYVDLNDDSLSDDAILNKLAQLSPICEHCIELNRDWFTDNPDEMKSWTRSKLNKNEWIKE